MNNNNFYIVDLDDLNLEDILSYCLEKPNTVRKNVAQTQCVVEMLGHINEPVLVASYSPYTYEEIKIVMVTPEWTPNDMI